MYREKQSWLWKGRVGELGGSVVRQVNAGIVCSRLLLVLERQAYGRGHKQDMYRGSKDGLLGYGAGFKYRIMVSYFPVLSCLVAFQLAGLGGS